MTPAPSNTLGHTVLRASAGSGKTYRLATRYLALLHAGQSPRAILATTFTRKAAGEILGRVLTRLSQVADRVAADSRTLDATLLGTARLGLRHGSFGDDFHVGYLPAAAVDIETCSERIDRAVYDVLPKTGTYSFGAEPNSDNNDIPAMWCVNASSAGTPQQANPPCP